jgi:hypothetical protein
MENEKYVINVIEDRILPNKKYGQYATNPKVFKIYVVSESKNIIYIGMTMQRISERFAQSFRAYNTKFKTGKCVPGGDSGYKWISKHKGKKSNLDLDIFSFSQIDDRKFIEAIEAEMAFVVRQDTGKWPECQNEIHFNNDYGNANKIAYGILEFIKTE